MSAHMRAYPIARILRLFAAAVLALSVLVSGVPWAGAEPAWSGNPERKNEGEVEFVLTPRGVSAGRFRVDISVTTHSGDLGGVNLQEAVELRAGGKSYRPVNPVAPRGHHTSGRLVFALDRVPDTFEIVIRGVRAMGDLTFRWP